jgi:hypothetical protein
MTAVFSEKEKKQAFNTKKRLLVLWFVALIVTVAVIVTLAVINAVQVNRDGDRTLKVPFLITTIALSTLFGGGSIFFFDIKYKLTSRYCKMLTGMKTGIKDHSHGKFIALDRTITEKDGVFFYSILLDCPPMKRGDVTERKILVERTHSLPSFEKGDEIKFITHANILVAYELCMDAVYNKLNDNIAKKTEGEE